VPLAGNEAAPITAITYVVIMGVISAVITLDNKPMHKTRKQAQAYQPLRPLIPTTPCVVLAISSRTTHRT
jgi:hypothetical protein